MHVFAIVTLVLLCISLLAHCSKGTTTVLEDGSVVRTHPISITKVLAIILIALLLAGHVI